MSGGIRPTLRYVRNMISMHTARRTVAKPEVIPNLYPSHTVFTSKCLILTVRLRAHTEVYVHLSVAMACSTQKTFFFSVGYIFVCAGGGEGAGRIQYNILVLLAGRKISGGTYFFDNVLDGLRRNRCFDKMY